MPITSETKCKINVGNTRCPLQIHLSGLGLSVCTKVQVDKSNSLGVVVLKMIFDGFAPNDLKIQGVHSIVDRHLA